MVVAVEPNLEIAYEKSCSDFQAACIAEKNRQFRLRALLLEEENGDLNAQLEQDDERIEELESFVEELQKDLNSAAQNSEDALRDLRTRDREVDALKTELGSLNHISTDSAKILTEKLALARELNSLRPELEHLRSLSSSHQNLLSEKLALQRQVTSFEVELENERRSAKRMHEKEGRAHAVDAKLEESLEAAQAELLKEKRERQKSNREHQKTEAELQNRIAMLESRLEIFRTKLKTTKQSLTDAQKDLQKAQAVRTSATSTIERSTPTAGNGRKRQASEMNADTMIGTPGDLPAAKRNRINQSLPGEKSTFSITPFLNRTTSVPPEDRVDNNDVDRESEKDEAASPTGMMKLKPANHKTMKTKGPNSTQGSEVPRETKTISQNGQQAQKNASKPPKRSIVAAPKLEKVAEEEDVDDNDNDAEKATKATQAPLLSTSNGRAAKVSKARAKPVDTVLEVDTVKAAGDKKKRRLLGGGMGKTLFDDDGGEEVKVGERKPGKSLVKLGAGARALGGPKLQAGRGEKTATGFGAISPLKKERRSVLAQ